MDVTAALAARAERRRVRQRSVGAIVCAIVAGAGAWFIGLDAVHAAILACAVWALAMVWVIPLAPPAQTWPEAPDATFDGVRGELSRLSWGLLTRQRRVRSSVVARVREIARVRLARRGLDLDDPADEAAVRDLLGPVVHEALAPPVSREIRLDALTACLDALQSLGYDPVTKGQT